MRIPRPSRLVRRVAKAAWQTARTRLEHWVAHDDVSLASRPIAAGTASAPLSSSLPARTTTATWTEHACRHVDRWVRRLLPAEGPDDARSVRRRRTALRRLRTILRATAPEGQFAPGGQLDGTDDAWRTADRALRRLARRLGPVREHDVALELVAARSDASDSDLERAALAELAARIARRREDAWSHAARRLGDDAIAEAVDAVRLCVAAAVTQAAPDVLARRWWQSAHAELARALSADDDDLLEHLHGIRIATREIRDGVELFDAAAPTAAAVLLAPCVAAQHAIGAHGDLALVYAVLAARAAKASRRGRVALARGLEAAAAATAERCAEARQRATAGLARLQALVSATAPAA